jgi:hypothetical protein
MQIHINRNGQQFGPYSVEELQALLQQGSISVNDWAWHDGVANWVQISQLDLGMHNPQVPPSAAEVVPQVEEISHQGQGSMEPQAEAQVDHSNSGVSAESAMERLRRLQRGRMPAGKTRQPSGASSDGVGTPGKMQSAEEFDVPDPKQSKGKLIATVILGVCIAGLIAYVAMKFFGSDKKSAPKVFVSEADNNDAFTKLRKIGAHVIRDQDKQISGIEFPGINISTNGWKVLTKLGNIQKLEMVGCGIDDAGVVNLRNFVHLKKLNLSGNEITDKSVEVLKTLTQLEALSLLKTQVTKNGVIALQAALPGCNIEH